MREQQTDLYPFLKKGSASRGVNLSAILSFAAIPFILYISIYMIGNFFNPPAPTNVKVIPTMMVGSPNKLPVHNSESDVIIEKQAVNVSKSPASDIDWIAIGLGGFNVWSWGSLAAYKVTKKSNYYIRLMRGGIDYGVSFVDRVRCRWNSLLAFVGRAA